jgi:5-methylcytosine-specific restriction endonuclease McrA
VTKDHQIALTKGGSEWPSNLVPACRQCNSLKNTRCPIEFRRMMVHG